MNTYKDVIYRCIPGQEFNTGVMACGYMPKPTSQSSQHHFVIGYYSCFLVLSGTGTYSDSSYKNIPITPGCFIQRIPGNVHSTDIHPDGQWLEFFISFGKPVYDSMDALGFLPKAPILRSAFDPTSTAYLDSLLARLKNAQPSMYPQLLMDMQKAVLTISREATPACQQEQLPQAIQKACTILSSDFSKNIELPRLAREMNLSYESFRKQFKKYIGTSPGQYRQEQRINQAALLIHSGISIKEAASMTGYGDAYAFTREFSKAMGCPPGKYRKNTTQNS